MFLGSYEFDGDVEVLMPAYQRLVESFPPGVIELQICVERPGGLTVYDTCPSETDFSRFSNGPDFAAAVAAAGLPEPRVSGLGEIQSAIGAAHLGATAGR
jgi:hypothetical protein